MRAGRLGRTRKTKAARTRPALSESRKNRVETR
jgi:hypothetical protein